MIKFRNLENKKIRTPEKLMLNLGYNKNLYAQSKRVRLVIKKYYHSKSR